MPKYFQHGRPSYKSSTHFHKPHHGVPPRHNSNHPLGNTDPHWIQLFDYLIVVDFECTCERDQHNYPNEIIEFPAVLVDVRRGVVDREASFHSYVKPWRNPTLTPFCTELTGIKQAQVDTAPDLQQVVKNFEQWFQDTIPRGAKVVFATDGPWDFKNFIFNGAILRDNVSFPTIFYEYIDIRTTFARMFNKGDSIKLDAMLKRMKLRFEGRPHCGFDDAVNIARLAVKMIENGCIFHFLVTLPLDQEELHYEIEGPWPVYRRDTGTGYIEREHVEERAKAAFGDAYFAFAEELAGLEKATGEAAQQRRRAKLSVSMGVWLRRLVTKRPALVFFVIAVLLSIIVLASYHGNTLATWRN
jgi:inhibitor of KinA sporulation pathway (predicted exonuclease)